MFATAASLLAGCRGGQTEGPAELSCFAREVLAVQLNCVEAGGSYRTLARVKDLHLVAVLREYLSTAKEGTLPERWPWEKFGLVLEAGDPANYQTVNCQYLFKPSSTDEPGYVQYGGKWYEVPAKLNALL
ncbi:MAG TPA: hypothetical protein GXX40_06335 [Firmicutes bacterium]|nr:hypothetical protein [Bacillota bacterium]